MSSRLFFRAKFESKVLECILNDAHGRVGGSKDGAYEHVAAKVLVADHLAAAEVLDPEPEK